MANVGNQISPPGALTQAVEMTESLIDRILTAQKRLASIADTAIGHAPERTDGEVAPSSCGPVGGEVGKLHAKLGFSHDCLRELEEVIDRLEAL